jgi:excisionase family DNA binding protein
MEMRKTSDTQGSKPHRGVLSAARRSPGGDSVCLTVSVEEAARMLGISRGAAYTHARDGSLPSIRLGKRLLVPKAALEKLLQAG